MTATIETERLILRPPVPDDRAALCAMWRDPRVMANLGSVKSEAECDATIARHAAYGPVLGFRVVERRDGGRVVGFCGLKPGAPDTPIAGMTEIGWMLAAEAWGQGFAREAAEACLAFAWTLCADWVGAIAAMRNGASRTLMARLGMRQFATFSHPIFAADDPLRDSVAYRISCPR